MKRTRCLRPAVRARFASSRLAFVAMGLLAGASALGACSSSDETQRPPLDRDSGGSAGNADGAASGAGAGEMTDAPASDGLGAAPDVSADAATNADADASIPADASPGGDAALADIRAESPVDVRGNDAASAPVDAPLDSRADASVDALAEAPVDSPADAPTAEPDAAGNPCALLIDDMETGIGHVNDGCRNGFWFTYNDGADAGTQQPPAGSTFAPSMVIPPRGTSQFAAHTTGTGHAFAGLGLNFNSPPAGVTRTYDASAYAGITFFAMGTGSIAVLFPDRDTDPGGLVCAVADRGTCNDHFGRQIVLSPTWQQYTVLFADVRQQGFGYAPPGGFDRSAVFGVLWQAAGSGAFDIWIDDLSFVAPGDGGTD